MTRRRQRPFVPAWLNEKTQQARAGSSPAPDQHPQPGQQGGHQSGEEDLWPPPKELARFESTAERLRRRLVGVVLLVAGIVAALGGWTGAMWASSHQGAPAHSAYAFQAVVTDCERYGPFSRAGFGFWWECGADVVGKSKSVRLHSSELTPRDIGKRVSLVEETGQTASSTSYHRDVDHPLRWLTVPLVVVGGILLFAFGGGALLRLVPQEIRLDVDKKLAAKLRARYHAEGRFHGHTPGPGQRTR